MAGQRQPMQFAPESQLQTLSRIAPGINALRGVQQQQMETAEAVRKQQAYQQFQNEVAKAFPGGVKELSRVFLTHGTTSQHFDVGQKLMQMAMEEDDRQRIFGGGGAPAMAEQPAAMPAAAPEAAPEMDFGAAGGVQPVNAMMAQAAPAKMLDYAGRQYSSEQVGQMLQSRSPQLQQLGRAIADANKPKPEREFAPSEISRLQQEIAQLPAGDPRRVPLEQRIQMLTTRPPAASTSVEVKLPEQQKAFEVGLGRAQADKLMADRAVAEDAASIIDTVRQGRELLKGPVFTGFGAEFLTSLGSALNTAGISFAQDAVANTQAFASNMAQNVGRIIKQFGAGTGLSNADREYAEKMAGGKITLDRKAIERILDINERAARNAIARHNRNVQGIQTNIPLTVEIPEVPFVPAGGAPQSGTRPPAAAAPTGAAPAGPPAVRTFPQPTQAAIDALKRGQGTDAQFDAIFGPGAAAKARGR
jgi:hypothetical protein